MEKVPAAFASTPVPITPMAAELKSSAEGVATPWFSPGLRFECTQCGDCCTGAPGYVWVNQAEINGMAALLRLGVEEFERKYVRQVGVRRSLVEFPNGDCVFLKNRRCQIYAARPRQCRTWPFWQSNIASEAAWRKTCEICPGCGIGDLVPVEQVLAQAIQMRL